MSVLGLVVMCGVLFTSVGVVGVVGGCGRSALLVDGGLFRVELVGVVVGWWWWGSLLVVGVLVKLGLMSAAVLRWRM